jgi:hypothetical protein
LSTRVDIAFAQYKVNKIEDAKKYIGRAKSLREEGSAHIMGNTLHDIIENCTGLQTNNWLFWEPPIK